MPDIEVRYPESVYDFIVSDNKQEYNIQNVNPQNPPKITYKGIYYELKKISFSGSSNQPKVDNSGQLFLTHESKDRKSFIFIIRIKPTSSNTEPSIDSFLKPPTINKIETTKLISNYIGNAFPVKTNAAETEFSCVIGHMRLTERDAINILKNLSKFCDSLYWWVLIIYYSLPMGRGGLCHQIIKTHIHVLNHIVIFYIEIYKNYSINVFYKHKLSSFYS